MGRQCTARASLPCAVLCAVGEMSSGCYYRTPQEECACAWADVGRSPAPHDNGSAVGADLRPSAPKLTSIKAHGHDRVTAALGGLLDEPLDRLLTTLSQHRRHSLELSSEERLHARSDLRADIA